MICFENAQFRYDPFPLGVLSKVFSQADYRELTSSYPEPELFRLEPGLGKRYTFAPHTNLLAYRAHFRRHAAWRELHHRVTSPAFLRSMIEMLLAHHVDLGIPPRRAWFINYLSRLARGLMYGQTFPLRARPQRKLIFAMLPADGGSLFPHTDTPAKLLNLAVSMSPEGEWNQNFGGGTDVNRPKDPRRWFNRTNQRLDFNEVEVLDTVPFLPNQAVLVVRTDNSWHSIRPMTGSGSPLLRKTLNINLLGGLL